jgi:hypothetical protein
MASLNNNNATTTTTTTTNATNNTTPNASNNDNNYNYNYWIYWLPPSTTTTATTTTSVTQSMANGMLQLTSGQRFIDSIFSNISYEEAVDANYFTGNRFLTEVSTCNYTLLTFGPHYNNNNDDGGGRRRLLLPWLIFLTVIFYIFTSTCSPSIVITLFIWVFIYPTVLFWAVYNVSPLCWPMVPPKLPQDIASEITPFVPKTIQIPPFMINQGCSLDEPSCFKQCRQDPFFMLSWQDPAAWWMCDLAGVSSCTWVANYVSNWGVLQDFASSSFYYADVITFASAATSSIKDPKDFVGAHRLCAFFMSYELIMAFIMLAVAIFVLPSVIQTIIEIFSAAVVLLTFAANAENVAD